MFNTVFDLIIIVSQNSSIGASHLIFHKSMHPTTKMTFQKTRSLWPTFAKTSGQVFLVKLLSRRPAAKQGHFYEIDTLSGFWFGILSGLPRTINQCMLVSQMTAYKTRSLWPTFVKSLIKFSRSNSHTLSFHWCQPPSIHQVYKTRSQWLTNGRIVTLSGFWCCTRISASIDVWNCTFSSTEPKLIKLQKKGRKISPTLSTDCSRKMLGKKCSRQHFEIFFLFLLEKKLIFHINCQPIFWEKKKNILNLFLGKKNEYVNLSSAEILQRVVKVKKNRP